MPCGALGNCYNRGPLTWGRMSRWQRKNFHKINARRERNGKPPLKKP